MKKISLFLIAIVLLASCAKQAVPEAEPVPDDTAVEETITPVAEDEGIVVEPYNVDRGEGTIVPGMVEEPYMIKRGDYLSKIARNELGDWSKWKEIYEYNKEMIGDNPDLIYPYRFLQLLKAAAVAKDCQVEFYEYTILEGDTPWNLAGKIFGDELAWIIIYMDNQDLIDRNGGIIYPGMVFQLRKNLDPCE
jgi:nucleoid-associated protein YgaU